MYDSDNVFAKILRREFSAHVIFETPSSLAILDAFPCVEGHALLIPKADIVAVEELEAQTPEFRAQFLADLARLAREVRAATGASATNVVVNNGPDSGQVVPHLHFHVIPRRKDDQLIRHPKSGHMTPEAALALLQKFHASRAATD